MDQAKKAEYTRLVLWAEREARFFRDNGAEPSQLVREILAKVPELEAAGLIERYRYRATVKAPAKG